MYLPTSVSRSGWAPPATSRAPAAGSARPTTSRPSRSRAATSTAVRTSTPSAASCTRCSPGSRVPTGHRIREAVGARDRPSAAAELAAPRSREGLRRVGGARDGQGSDDRFSSAGALAAAVRDAVAEQEAEGRRVSMATPPRGTRSRRRCWRARAGAAAFAAAGRAAPVPAIFPEASEPAATVPPPAPVVAATAAGAPPVPPSTPDPPVARGGRPAARRAAIRAARDPGAGPHRGRRLRRLHDRRRHRPDLRRRLPGEEEHRGSGRDG